MIPVAKKYYLEVIFSRIRRGDDPKQYRPFLKRWAIRDYKPLYHELGELLNIINNNPAKAATGRLVPARRGEGRILQ
jgi:hypothetical protein